MTKKKQPEPKTKKKEAVWKARFLSPDKKQLIVIGHQDGVDIVMLTLKAHKYIVLHWKRAKRTEGDLYKK